MRPRYFAACIRSARSLRLLVALWFVAAFSLSHGSVQAALELLRLEVIPLEGRVRIVWETSRELDVAGFQLFYKRADEPTDAYQPIGDIIPGQGNLQQGAVYSAEFFQLIPDITYCFLLVEVPLGGEEGDRFERCGYGLNVTPSPTPMPSLPPTETPTPSDTPLPTDLPTLEATATPLATPTALPSDTPLPPPTLPPTPLPDGVQAGDVIVAIQTPTPEAAGTYIVLTATLTPRPAESMPTPTALPTATPTRGLPLQELVLLVEHNSGLGAGGSLIVALVCLTSGGLALLGLMALLGSILYIRTRL